MCLRAFQLATRRGVVTVSLSFFPNNAIPVSIGLGAPPDTPPFPPLLPKATPLVVWIAWVFGVHSSPISSGTCGVNQSHHVHFCDEYREGAGQPARRAPASPDCRVPWPSRPPSRRWPRRGMRASGADIAWRTSSMHARPPPHLPTLTTLSPPRIAAPASCELRPIPRQMEVSRPWLAGAAPRPATTA